MEQDPQLHNHSWPGTDDNLVHRHPVEDGHPDLLELAHPVDLPNPPAQIDNAAMLIALVAPNQTEQQHDAVKAAATAELHTLWTDGYQAGKHESRPPAQVDNAAYRIVVDSGLSMTMEQGDALRAMAADELHASWLAGYQAGQRASEPRAGQ